MTDSTPSQLQQVIDHFKSQIAAQDDATIAQLVKRYASTRKRLISRTNQLAQIVIAQGDKQNPTDALKLASVKRLLDTLEEELASFGDVAAQAIVASQAATLSGAELAMASMVQAQLKDLTWKRADPRAIQSMLGRLADGSPLGPILDRIAPDYRANVEQILVDAITKGTNVRAVGKMLNAFSDEGLSKATQIATDAVLGSYRNASFASMQANADVVPEWEWGCAFQARTCAFCLGMGGRRFPISKGFMEAHSRCRCTPIPVVAGTPATLESGREWLKKQPPAVQDQVLGKKAGELYRAGHVNLRDFMKITPSDQWGPSGGQGSINHALANAQKRGVPPPPAGFGVKEKAPAPVKPAKTTTTKAAPVKKAPAVKEPAAAKPVVAEPVAAAKVPAMTGPQRTITPGADFTNTPKVHDWFKGKDKLAKWSYESNQAAEKAKTTIQKELGTRLAADPLARKAITDWYEGDQTRQGNLPKAIDDAMPVRKHPKDWTDQEWEMVTGHLANNYVKTWAGTSGDSDYSAVAMQNAIEKEFQLTNVWKNYSKDTLDGADDFYGPQQPIMRRVARAQYEWTQEELAAAGIDSVPLYRGMVITDPRLERIRSTREETTVPVQLASLSSFSYKLRVANDFATGEFVFAGSVPRELIMSTARTGFGCLNEYEFVVLGGEYELAASQRGAKWKRKAEANGDND